MTIGRFTDDLLFSSGEKWDRVVNHRFTKELAAGTIDRKVLARYLIQDFRFLDAFIILLASVISNARSLEDRIPGCQFLAHISGAENTYFERCFQKLLGDLHEKHRKEIPNHDCTSEFINLMVDVSRKGSLGEMLAVLVVCEWSYLSWAQKVLNETNREDFVTCEWVDLHSGDYFEGVVNYLRGLLDQEAEFADEVEKEKIKRAFLEAVELEERFFENAYNV